MSMFVVYSRSSGVKYKASVCSKAFILYVVLTLLTFTLPILFCYRSNGKLYIVLWFICNTVDYYFTLHFSGLWLKYDRYRELPRVEFKLQYFLYAETSDPMSPLICGNFPQHFHTLETKGFCSAVKVSYFYYHWL